MAVTDLSQQRLPGQAEHDGSLGAKAGSIGSSASCWDGKCSFRLVLLRAGSSVLKRCSHSEHQPTRWAWGKPLHLSWLAPSLNSCIWSVSSFLSETVACTKITDHATVGNCSQIEK